MNMRGSWMKGSVCFFTAVSIMVILFLATSKTVNLSPRSRARAILGSSPIKTGVSSEAQNSAIWQKRYGSLPMSFVENRGQASPDTLFTAQGKGYGLLLTEDGAVLALRNSEPRKNPTRHSGANGARVTKQLNVEHSSLLALKFADSDLHASIQGLDELPGRTDYFVGDNPAKWRTNVPSFARVEYGSVYPGVDLVFYGNQRHLEYDFHVAPGTDVSEIALQLSGANGVKVERRGALRITTPSGAVEFEKPVAYQFHQGRRQEVASNYDVRPNGEIHFSVAPYDGNAPLVIDPVLDYSTYLGGSSDDTGFGIAVDGSGDAYVAGQTFSTDFPNTSNAFNQSSPGVSTGTAGAVFVTELNPAGSTEIYSTYLSGSGGEGAFALALDTSNNIYVTGQTFSTDYPTTSNALKQSPLASNANGTAFLSVINPTASGVASLLYSTYVGGSGGDTGNGVAVDASQNAYITGGTASTDFPVMNSIQGLNSTSGNAFLTRIDVTKSGAASLIYSTYLGGSGTGNGTLLFADTGNAVAVDTSSNAYITGATTSTDFPTTTNAYVQAPLASAANGAVFVSRIDTTKTGTAALIYSSYLAGNPVGASGDYGFGIALGPSNVAYVAGETISSTFPTTTGSYPSNPNPSLGVAFLSLVDTTQSGSSSLKYSTLLGGSNGDGAFGVRVDSMGHAFLIGTTGSSNFPVTPGAFQPSLGTAAGAPFISEINPVGNGVADLLYSTYLGGSAATDFGEAIGVDGNGNVYATGNTSSTTFPIFPKPGAFQTSLDGTSDAFVTKLTPEATLTISPLTVTFSSPILIGNTSTPQAVTLTNNTGVALAVSFSLSGTNPGDFAATPGGTTPCPATLPATATPCTINVTFTPSLNGAESANLVFSYTAYGSATTQTVQLSGTGTNASITVSPSGLTFPGQLVTTTSTAQPVTLTNNGSSTLTISSINASGDFGQTNGCNGSLAGLTGCTINVTFTPTSTTNPRTGTLTITDSDPSSPQTVQLTGTGWDFSLGANPTTISVQKGQTSQPVSISVTGLGGFNGSVSLSCTGAPKNSTCSVSSSATPTTPGTLTLMTEGFLVAPESFKTTPPSHRQIVLIFLALVLMSGLLAARKTRTRIGLAAIFFLVVLASCSNPPSTPSGPFTLTVTGTSGTVSHTVTISGTVN